MDRIERIQELYALITPLKENRLFLDLKKQLKQITTEELAELEKITAELEPLIQEFEKNRALYLVTYEGKLYDHRTNSFYWGEPRMEQFYFNTFCDIDSLNQNTLNIEGLSDLMIEISRTLYLIRFNHFNILNIKRIK
jgi:hypothetical protein